jgi:hypothetical protein
MRKTETAKRKKFSDLSLLDAYDRMKEIIRTYVDPQRVSWGDKPDVEEICFHD